MGALSRWTNSFFTEKLRHAKLPIYFNRPLGIVVTLGRILALRLSLKGYEQIRWGVKRLRLKQEERPGDQGTHQTALPAHVNLLRIDRHMRRRGVSWPARRSAYLNHDGKVTAIDGRGELKVDLLKSRLIEHNHI